jgi:hypothetical protein
VTPSPRALLTTVGLTRILTTPSLMTLGQDLASDARVLVADVRGRQLALGSRAIAGPRAQAVLTPGAAAVHPAQTVANSARRRAPPAHTLVNPGPVVASPASAAVNLPQAVANSALGRVTPAHALVNPGPVVASPVRAAVNFRQAVANSAQGRATPAHAVVNPEQVVANPVRAAVSPAQVVAPAQAAASPMGAVDRLIGVAMPLAINATHPPALVRPLAGPAARLAETWVLRAAEALAANIARTTPIPACPQMHPV